MPDRLTPNGFTQVELIKTTSGALKVLLTPVGKSILGARRCRRLSVRSTYRQIKAHPHVRRPCVYVYGENNEVQQGFAATPPPPPPSSFCSVDKYLRRTSTHALKLDHQACGRSGVGTKHPRHQPVGVVYHLKPVLCNQSACAFTI